MHHHEDFTTKFSVTSTCPACGGRLVLRERRDGTGSFFGCRAFPACKITIPYDKALSDLAARVRAAEIRLPAGGIPPATFDRELRRLLGLVHPDKWQNSLVAEELTKAIVDLRERLQKRS